MPVCVVGEKGVAMHVRHISRRRTGHLAAIRQVYKLCQCFRTDGELETVQGLFQSGNIYLDRRRSRGVDAFYGLSAKGKISPMLCFVNVKGGRCSQSQNLGA